MDRKAMREAKPRRAGAALAGLLLLAAARAALAQDIPSSGAAGSEEDPFDAAAFGAATSSASADAAPGSPGAGAAPAAAAAKTEYLFGGSVLVSASAFSSLAGGLPDGYAASAGASGRIFGKVSVPDYGTLYISYNALQAFFEGLGGSGPAALAPPADLAAPSYALAELYYSFDIGKALFVRLGKQLLAWGPSRVWTPVDFVNRQRADSFASLDLRQGKSGLKLFLPLGKASALLFADFSGLVSGGTVGDPLEAASLAGRIDAALGGFELGLTGFASRASQSKAGFDFSGDILGFAAYGELAYAPAYSAYPSSYQASLGLSRALGDLKRWTVSAEGFWNSAGSALTGSALGLALQSGAAEPLYIGAWYGYASIAAKELLSPSLTTSLSALANLSDFSYSIRLAEDFSFPRSVPFSLILSFAGGGEGKEFTLASGDRSVSISAQTRLDF
jgi:hypothetical protein